MHLPSGGENRDLGRNRSPGASFHPPGWVSESISSCPVVLGFPLQRKALPGFWGGFGAAVKWPRPNSDRRSGRFRTEIQNPRLVRAPGEGGRGSWGLGPLLGVLLCRGGCSCPGPAAQWAEGAGPAPLPLLPGYFHRIVPSAGRMSPARFLSASKGCGAGRESRGLLCKRHRPAPGGFSD